MAFSRSASYAANEFLLSDSTSTLRHEGNFAETPGPLNSFAQGSGSGAYVVQRSGETLGSIAQNLWGDASLWYKLAEANGLGANGPLLAERPYPASASLNRPSSPGFRRRPASTAISAAGS